MLYPKAKDVVSARVLTYGLLTTFCHANLQQLLTNHRTGQTIRESLGQTIEALITEREYVYIKSSHSTPLSDEASQVSVKRHGLSNDKNSFFFEFLTLM